MTSAEVLYPLVAIMPYQLASKVADRVASGASPMNPYFMIRPVSSSHCSTRPVINTREREMRKGRMTGCTNSCQYKVREYEIDCMRVSESCILFKVYLAFYW